MPFILTGLRLAVGRALIGVMVGELYAATAGIGFMITVAGATFQTDKVFVGVLIFAITGMIMTDVIDRYETASINGVRKWALNKRSGLWFLKSSHHKWLPACAGSRFFVGQIVGPQKIGKRGCNINGWLAVLEGFLKTQLHTEMQLRS